MAKAISKEKRADIVRHMVSGEKKEDISKWLCICVRSVERIWNKYQTTGKYEAEPQNSGRKPLVSEEQMIQVMKKIEESPDITLRELIEELDLGISEPALCKRLIKAGLTYKKRRCELKGKKEKML